MPSIASLIIAFSTYSRIPMPQTDWSEKNRRGALCFFPLVGLAAGGAVALWLYVCGLLSLQGLLKGAVAAALPLWVTGGIHMDGFMDTCDAMASWQSAEKRLEILKDSHIGAFAALWAGVYLLMMAGLLSECGPENALALGACFLLSRSVSALFSVTLKQARPGGMLDGFSGAKKAVRIFSAVYAVIAAAVLILCKAYFVLPAMALTSLYAYRRFYKYFGGITGDLAGWLLQMNELCGIAALVLGGKIL